MPGYRAHLAGSAGTCALVGTGLVAGYQGGYVPPEVIRPFVVAPASFAETVAPAVGYEAGSEGLRFLYVSGLFAVGTIFGLFPDVDLAGTYGRRYFGYLFVLLEALLLLSGFYLVAGGVALFAFACAGAQHRGWTHDWWASIAVPALLFLLPSVARGVPETGAAFAVSAGLGYVSHLLLDEVVSASKRPARRKRGREEHPHYEGEPGKYPHYRRW